MKGLFKRLSLVPRGLRYKLMVSFCLMSIIPLLVCVYLVSCFIFPQTKEPGQVSIVVILSVVIALLGFVLAKRMIDPVINIALETKIIAEGDYDRVVKTFAEDEIGELGQSINMMTKKIKDHMSELQDYSVKTKEINLEIQKKVLALSNLLQIGDMIASSKELGDVLDAIVQKVSDVDGYNFTVLFLIKENSTRFVPVASSNINVKFIENISFDLEKDYVGALVKERAVLKIDYSSKLTPQKIAVLQSFGTKNCLLLPVTSRGKGVGFIVTGNDRERFRFKDEDAEIIKVLCKQLGIAIENDVLLKKAKELAIKDELTDLYNERYIEERLEEEIKRAILYQRPCSLVLFNIDDFKKLKENEGDAVAEEALRRVGRILTENSTNVAKVARLKNDAFCIVLPEKNKKEAMQLAEDMRKEVEKAEIRGAKKGRVLVTVSGSVSENPIDGISARELFDKAIGGMKKAKLEGKNRIAV